MAPLRSGCDAERAIDELHLANKSAFGSHRICPSRTMFMDVCCDCPQCAVNRSEPLTAYRALFDEAMILLKNVVKVGCSATSTPTRVSDLGLSDNSFDHLTIVSSKLK
jgi:hypothetical protein